MDIKDIDQRLDQPVLLIGAGRGGVAMIGLFKDENNVRIVGVADSNPDAPGLALARQRGIPTYQNVEKALQSSGQCFVINLTHDEEVSEMAASFVGIGSVMGGQSAKLFWMMVRRLKTAGDELQRSRDKLHAMIQFAVDGIFITDTQGSIATFNRAAEKIFGYEEREVIGKDVSMLIPVTTDNKLTVKTGKMTDLNCREVNGRRKDGSIFPMDISTNILKLSEGKYFVGIFRDITERKAIEEKIRFMAEYDQLTGLPNRHLFFERLDWAVKYAKRHEKKLAALFLDLDGFKQINDTHGHESGDKLLVEVAGRLQACVRESDSVARLGGDEFIILLPDVNDIQSADLVANKVLQSLSNPFFLNDAKCHVGGSVGIAIFPDDAQDAKMLVSMADDAMYRVKSSGKNSFKYFHELCELYDDPQDKVRQINSMLVHD